MSRQELNTEIHQILSNLSEDDLHAVLNYLKSIKGVGSAKLQEFNNLGKILKEDSELLKRLAQ